MAFTIIYDTFCGWCYGAHSLFEALAKSGESVTLLHRALFSAGGAHELWTGFGERAWSVDQRISALSGRSFSETYRDRVLQRNTGVLNSWSSALAAAWVRRHGPQVELALAAQLQHARFVEGREAADASVLVEAIAHLGLPVGEAYAALTESDALRDEAARTRDAAAEALARAGRSGVPTILQDGIPIDLAPFLGQPERFLAKLSLGQSPSSVRE